MSTASGQPVAPEGYKLKKKKPIYKRVWFWLLVIIVVIIAATAGGGGNDDSPTVSGGTAASNSGEATTEAPAAEAPTSEAPAPAPAGPTFQGQTEDDTTAEPGQTITIDDVAITSTALVAGDDTFGPTLCTTVSIVNNGDDSVSFNPFDYKLQDPAGASRNSTFGGSDTLLNSGDLATGGTVTGDICFDQAAEAAGTYALIYAPTFSFSNDRAVWVNNR